MKRSLNIGLRFTFGAALILVLLKQIDVDEILERVLNARPLFLVLAAVVFGLARVSEACRLHALLPRPPVVFGKIVKIVFISTFFNNFSTPMVGDGYRTMALWKASGRFDTSIATVIADRLFGAATIAAFAVAYLAFAGDRIRMVLTASEARLDITTTAVVVVLLIVGSGALAALLARHRLAAFLARLEPAFEGLRSIGTTRIVGAFLATLGTQLFVTLMVYLLILAFRERIDFIDVLAIMILVFIAGYLPITVGSLGVREGLIFLGLSAFGASEDVSFATGITSRIMIYIYAVVGGFWLLISKPAASGARQEESR